MLKPKSTLPDYRDNVLDAGSGLRKRFPEHVEALSRRLYSNGNNFETWQGGKKNKKVINILRTSLRGRLLSYEHDKSFDKNPYHSMIAHLDFHQYRTLKKNGADTLVENFLQKHMSTLLEEVKEREQQEAKRQSDIAKEKEEKETASPVALHLPIDSTEENRQEIKEEPEQATETQVVIQELIDFQHGLLLPNKEQQEALNAAQPLIINGLPGTGKSFVAMGRLLNALDDVAEEKESGRVLYFTSSKKLCKSMESMREDSPAFDASDEQKIEFKTPLDLLHDLAPETQQMELAEKKYFTGWLARYATKYAALLKLLKETLSEDADLNDFLYQECRAISDSSKKEYENAGEDQSLFPKGKELRNKVHDLLQDYREHLNATYHVDPAFYQFNPPETFYQIVIDEAQDLSPLQLSILARLAKTQTIARFLPAKKANERPPETKKNISIFYDPHQSLNDSLSKLPCLKKIFDKELASLELTESFRCSERVMETANVFLAMGIHITGAQDNIEHKMTPPVNHVKGHATWIDTPTEEQKQEISTLVQSHKCAIITRPEFVEAARTAFSWKVIVDGKEEIHYPQVYTVEQAKGLEFETAICWRLFENTRFHAINKILATFGETTHLKTKGRTKTIRPEYGPDMCSVFTAFTRAKTSLIIHNGSPNNVARNNIRHIRTHLQKTMNDKEPSKKPLSNTLGKSTKQDWLRQIEENLKINNVIIARNLYLGQIENNPEKFSEFVSAWRKTNEPGQKNTPSTLKKKLILNPYKLEKMPDNELKSRLSEIIENDQIDCLLNISIKDRSFILHITENDNKYEILKDLLSRPDYAKKITAEHLRTLRVRDGKIIMPLLDYLLSRQRSRELFLTLVTAHPEIAREFTTLDLARMAHEFPDFSILHLFCPYSDTRKIFKILLDNNEDLGKGLTARDLFFPKKEKSFGLPNSSPALWLSDDACGNQIFDHLSKINKDMIKEIKADDLKRRIPPIARQDGNKSVFYNLAKNNPALLLKIFKGNNSLFDHFTAEDILFEVQEGKNVLYFLTLDPEGRELLDLFMEKIPAFKEKINLAVLAKPKPPNNSSPLIQLCNAYATTDNQLLEKFLPAIVKDGTADILFRPATSISQIEAVSINYSCMTALASSAKGCKMILTLLEQMPDLPNGITVNHMLDTFVSGTLDKNTQTTFYHMLKEHPDGLEALDILFDKNQQLEKDVLARRMSISEKPVTPLETKPEFIHITTEKDNPDLEKKLTCSDEEFKTILSNILKSHDISELFDKPIKGKPLFKHMEDDLKKFQLFEKMLLGSADYTAKVMTRLPNLLTKVKSGRTLFCTLAKAHPAETSQVLAATDLTQILPGTDITLLHIICRDPKPRQVLADLLLKNKAIGKNFTAGALFLPRGAENSYKNTSAAYWLSEDSDGHAIFSHLLDVNPNIIKEITADHLKQARPGFAGEDANKSVFYNLAKHNPALLLRIFEGNRALAKAFTLQDLTLPVANDKTALAHLEASPFGQNILKIFGVENPELALTLTFFKNMNNLSVTGTPQTLFNNTTTPSGIEPVTKQPPNRKKTAAGMEIKMR